MVIRYVPRGPIDALSARALVELSGELGPPVVLGGWMTRVWAVARGRDARVTNDLDVTYLPEVLAVPEVAAGLRRLGYQQDDRGYPFRYTRMSKDGLLIVDLLCDAGQQIDPSAQPVFGVAFATERLESFDLAVVDVGVARVLVPAIERATVLRLLALDQGPGMVRFAAYAIVNWRGFSLVWSRTMIRVKVFIDSQNCYRDARRSSSLRRNPAQRARSRLADSGKSWSHSGRSCPVGN